MAADIETSLNNFRTDYIDLYQVHNPSMEQLDQVIGEGGALEALIEAKAAGKIGHIGLTAHSTAVFERALELDWVETIMFPYNIVEQQGAELIRKCAEKNIGFIDMKPLAGGAIEDGTLALRYVCSNPDVTVVIPGMAEIRELDENMAACSDSTPLTEEELKKMEEVRAQLGNDFCRRCNAIAANGLTSWRLQYACPNIRGEAYTIYTNTPVGGAMRGYGIPQVCFAIESFMDDVANEIHMDPLEFRRKNLIQGYYEDAYLKPIAANTNGIFECLEKGAEYIHWDEKRKEYAEQTGDVRKGVGMALFSYKTGVWPISLEIAGARLSLNQDGSVQLMLGATEIGQGADTVFSQ
mgnify:CR=1 FL=1